MVQPGAIQKAVCWPLYGYSLKQLEIIFLVQSLSPSLAAVASSFMSPLRTAVIETLVLCFQTAVICVDKMPGRGVGEIICEEVERCQS